MEAKLEKLVGLIICKSQSDATSLATLLQPEIPFESVDHTNSLLKAIHAQEELKAQVCFISDEFEVDEIKVFTKDVRSLHKDISTVIIQFVKEIKPGFDRKSLTSYGIDLVITNSGNDKDKEELLQVLAEFSMQAEIKRKTVSIKKVLDLLLKEVNRVSEGKRRGTIKDLTINTIPAEYVAAQTSWNEEVQKRYFEMLIDRTIEAEAPIADHLVVPDAVLEKQLPHLESDTYRGISHRVWTKLQKKHGVKKKKDAPKENTADNSN